MLTFCVATANSFRSAGFADYYAVYCLVEEVSQVANIEPRKNREGRIVSYLIRGGRGSSTDGKRLIPYTMNWTPEEGMTKRQIQAEVNRQAVLFEERCRCGEQAVSSNLKLRDFIPQYLDTVSVTLSPTTLHLYKKVIESHIIPQLGNKKLCDIKPADVQFFIKYLAEFQAKPSPNNKSGRLSASTLRRYLCVLQSIFKLAVKFDLIAVNPANAGKLTLPKKVIPKIEIFNKAEAAEMLRCLEQESLASQTYVQLAIITGARRGELGALKFSDFDYQNCRLTISRAVIKVDGEKTAFKAPKDNEVRTVTVNEHCIELVKMLREHYEKEKLRLSDKWVGDEWLFTKWNGEIMNLQTPTKQFRLFLKRHGLKHRKLHSLRHTSATLLLYGGINIRQVQQRLGHSELETTQKYLHCLTEADVEAVNVLTNMLEPNRVRTVNIEAG